MPRSPESDSPTDAHLVAAANRGDVRAFEALYYRYRDWVLRLARRFTGNDEDALDVLQETFTYILRKLPNLHLSARMTTFLYPVVRNLSIAIRRKRGRQVTAGDQLDNTAAPPVPEELAAEEELCAVVSLLPEEQREPLLMRYAEGMTQREIAEALGLPVGTVKSRLHRALETLRAHPHTRRYFGE